MPLAMKSTADAKAYIDYHLDWLHAAVRLAIEPDGGAVRPNLAPGGRG